MYKSIVSIFIIILFAAFSCKSGKESSSSTPPGPPQPPSEGRGDQLQDDVDEKNKKLYSLVVSFYSVASGIDHKARKRFEEQLEKFKSEKGYNFEASINPWGREGEVDYCIDLHELSTSERESFIEEVKTTLQEGKHINIKKNARCVHKR